MAKKTKGGGTKKVCLPAAKVRSMSKEERRKVVAAKRTAAAWKAWEKSYLEKPGGKEEAARERREFYCDNGKIKLRPSDDADVPLTDKQIKKSKKTK